MTVDEIVNVAATTTDVAVEEEVKEATGVVGRDEITLCAAIAGSRSTPGTSAQPRTPCASSAGRRTTSQDAARR